MDAKRIDMAEYSMELASQLKRFAATAEREIVGRRYRLPCETAAEARHCIRAETIGALTYYLKDHDDEIGPRIRARAVAILDAAEKVIANVIPELERKEEERRAGPPKDLAGVKAIAERGELPR